MNKSNPSESDTVDKYIRPAIVQAGWHTFDQIYAQYPLRAGRVVVRGKVARRDKSTVLFADFVLFLKPNIPLAVVEAKKSGLSVQAGTQQATNYAELLDVPFSFAQASYLARPTKSVKPGLSPATSPSVACLKFAYKRNFISFPGSVLALETSFVAFSNFFCRSDIAFFLWKMMVRQVDKTVLGGFHGMKLGLK